MRNYSIPRDKEKLMYDFYVLSYLDQFNLDNNIGAKISGFGDIVSSPTMRRELDINTKDSYNKIKNRVLKYLQRHLLRCVFYSISAEFRHILDETTECSFTEETGAPEKLVNKFKNWKAEDFLNEYIKLYNENLSKVKSCSFRQEKNKDRTERKEKDTHYLSSYKAIKVSKINNVEFIKIAHNAFSKLSWSKGYGGKAWKNICNGWLQLYNAKNNNELVVAIDHIYDLQHNSDSVLNKLDSYYKNKSGYKWINNALDFKANISSPYKLLEYCTPNMKKIALRILKSEGYEAWETFSKNEAIKLNDPYYIPETKPDYLKSAPKFKFHVGDRIKVVKKVNQVSYLEYDWKSTMDKSLNKEYIVTFVFNDHTVKLSNEHLYPYFCLENKGKQTKEQAIESIQNDDKYNFILEINNKKDINNFKYWINNAPIYIHYSDKSHIETQLEWLEKNYSNFIFYVVINKNENKYIELIETKNLNKREDILSMNEFIKLNSNIFKKIKKRNKKFSDKKYKSVDVKDRTTKDNVAYAIKEEVAIEFITHMLHDISNNTTKQLKNLIKAKRKIPLIKFLRDIISKYYSLTYLLADAKKLAEDLIIAFDPSTDYCKPI